MEKEEIKQYLKDNLSLYIEEWSEVDYSTVNEGVKIILILEGEEISSESFRISSK